MYSDIGIYSSASVSGGGVSGKELINNLNSSKTKITEKDTKAFVSITEDGEELVESLLKSNKLYRHLDRATLLACVSSDITWNDFKDRSVFKRVGLSVGSSRGTTNTIERSHLSFLNEGKVHVSTSPTTTFGCLTSTIAQHLSLTGPVTAHSSTCTSGLVSLLHGYSMIKSQMADSFIAVGAEAPLTPYTEAQMKALGVLVSDLSLDYPSQPLGNDPDRPIGLLLGEAASSALLAPTSDELPLPKAILKGIATATEPLKSLTGMTDSGDVLKNSMIGAIEMAGNPQIDLVLSHTPGTKKGDAAELNAISEVFEKREIPPLYSPKWLTGHTFGASGLLALEIAIELFQGAKLSPLPYNSHGQEQLPLQETPQNILINTAGFGGMAVSAVVSRAQ